MRGLPTIAAAASLLVAVAAPPARAGVDAEVPLVLRAKGSLGAETDGFRFTAPEGTLLSARLAAAKGHGFSSLSMDLFDPDGDDVPLPEDTADTGTKIRFKGLVLPETGEYRLEITADGSGDYNLHLKGRPRTLWSGESDLTGGPVTIALSTPAGATVALRATRE